MNLEQELQAVKDRNARVEADKAWETSWARILTIFFITYVFAAWWLSAIGAGRPFLNALVPTAGYLLSTQTIPPLKRWWVKNYLKRRA